MYKELDKNEAFSDTYATWIIAYCLDTDSFSQQIKDISFGNTMMNSSVKMMQ